MGEAQPRRQFTLRDLAVGVTVICVLLALGVMAVSSMRTRSAGPQCSNNMRMLGLATHNYHDAHNELPPLANGDGGWSWVAHLLPYCEGPTSPDPRTQLQPAAPAGRAFVAALRFPLLLCSTRRSQGRRSGGTFAGGVPTDYVAVSTSTRNQWSSTSDGMLVLCKSPPTKTTPVVSATTFAHVTDGLANTAMIGEKHMRESWFGGPLDEPALVAFKGPNTVRLATDAAGTHGLAGPDSTDRQAFGSWHSGITLFVNGDASVRPVFNKAAPGMLRRYTSRNDGQEFQFPNQR